MISEITINSMSGRGSVNMKTRDYTGYWLGLVNWGQVQGRHQTYKYYNQVGSSIVGTSVQERPISIPGWVVDAGGNTLQERCDFLNTFISPVEDYELWYNGKKIQFRPDASVAYGKDYIKNNEKVRRFLIQGTCPFPLFKDISDTVVTFEESGKRFHFPTDFGQKTPLIFAVLDKAYGVNVRNNGGFASGFVARIRFTGNVDNPRIHNMTTGNFAGVARSFTRGEQLEISTVSGSKHMYLWTPDGKQVDLIKYRDFRTSWIQLQPGENRIAIDCDDLNERNNMEVTLYYTSLYLEVE